MIKAETLLDIYILIYKASFFQSEDIYIYIYIFIGKRTKTRISAGTDTSQVSQATGEPEQLSSSIRKTGNDKFKNLHDDEEMKLSSDSGQYGEEGRN